ncbi:MAG: NAD(P)H-quinone oxidoreductase [Chloroflexi bacterium]|nr:NAD(P)H-quinone oxidoreductase [Chloroflexota bacterium]MCI0580940.1 NAD(P)H-quinone oxidoreductase [Chloroflexota bacterium]MCI0645028.1 NAD(P)H-quinone oxidoreductase [Chloroflexota bacterium]MCI0725603.1 NAD(P)H-quinone oxidoreductase [Chloroflexota bacterium]
MKAIVVHKENAEPRLVWEEVADVTYGPEEVLVNVKATAVNRADLSQARGNYPPPPGVTDILGLEMAGIVQAVGERVASWRPGDRVCALLAGGGYAEQVAVHLGMLLRLPEEWTFAQGAAVPEVWYTAYVNLFLEGSLQAGETVLIHAGGSGVGTAAVQLARQEEATVFVTAGVDFKLDFCRQLGAALAINYKQQDFLEAVLAATQGEGVDLILDPVGADYLDRNLKALRSNGRLVHIGLMGGRKAELNLGLVLGKSLRLVGSRLRPRPLAEKIAITRQFEEQVWPLLQSGQLRPIVDKVFPIAEAQSAHEYVRQNKNLGKVVMRIED